MNKHQNIYKTFITSVWPLQTNMRGKYFFVSSGDEKGIFRAKVTN